MTVFENIGGLRLTLIGLSLLSLPMVFFTGMYPEGVGVLTAYIIPSVVVLFFFVLLLDALMNRIFMIEQPDAVRHVKRRRMWWDLATSAALLLVWGTHFRNTLLI
jgi:hypothetical protein